MFIRKIKKIIILFVCVVLICSLITDKYFNGFVKKFSISLISDELIASDNQVKGHAGCRIPKLLADDPSVNDLLEHHYPMTCSPMKNWVYTKNGKFYIDSSAVEKYGKIRCDYYHIKRINENEEAEIEYRNFPNDSWILGDGFRVLCQSESGYSYRNVHFSVPDLEFGGKSKSAPKKRTKSFMANLHIFFFFVDSLSRINAVRKLPKFYKMLTEEMQALDMQAFNIVGDGTPWSLIPLTTGHFQNELPEARKRFENASFLDDWPFIFKKYKDAGYGTAFAEEQPHINAFTYKLKGFNETPVDHYLRPILKVANSEQRFQEPYCLGDTPKSVTWLNYWHELKSMYESYDKRTLAILFTGETSHDDYNLVQTLDEHLERGFRNLHRKNALNNTVLFVMGDHGRRFGPFRQTQSGKLEEKLPLLTVAVPSWFRRVYPDVYANLLTNRNRLLTVFDLHATLKHILTFDSVDVTFGDKTFSAENSKSRRGLSLFRRVPADRSCLDADVKPHFCACLEWSPAKRPSTDGIVIKAVNFALDEINEKLRVTNGACLSLKLVKIISANIYRPNENLLSFKESADYDNYVQDMTSNSSATFVYYQIRFVTWPGDADWELTLTHYLDLKIFKFVEDDLSRLNSYGDQPNCISNAYPHLRTFCYCVNNTD